MQSAALIALCHKLQEERSQCLWQALERFIPDIRDRAELTLVGTPLTHERFLNRHKGTYGAAISAASGSFPRTTNPGTWPVQVTAQGPLQLLVLCALHLTAQGPLQPLVLCALHLTDQGPLQPLLLCALHYCLCWEHEAWPCLQIVAVLCLIPAHFTMKAAAVVY